MSSNHPPVPYRWDIGRYSYHRYWHTNGCIYDERVENGIRRCLWINSKFRPLKNLWFLVVFTFTLSQIWFVANFTLNRVTPKVKVKLMKILPVKKIFNPYNVTGPIFLPRLMLICKKKKLLNIHFMSCQLLGHSVFLYWKSSLIKILFLVYLVPEVDSSEKWSIRHDGIHSILTWAVSSLKGM